MENLYLRDWVEYHMRLGFDAIILYDNNDINGEYPQMVIGDYIRNGFVIYRDVRGKYRYQLEAYGECYKEFCHDYDWIGFFDVDEFVTLQEGFSFINDFLSMDIFNKPDIGGICVYWEIYGDNNLLHYENKPVYTRFTTPKYLAEKGVHCFKIFIKAGKNCLDNLTFYDANAATFNSNDGVEKFGVNTKGEIISPWELYKKPYFNNCYLRHYNTLTIDEFLYRRFGRRAYADKASSYNKENIMKIFYSINEMTPEKEKIIKDFFENFKVTEDNV